MEIEMMDKRGKGAAMKRFRSPEDLLLEGIMTAFFDNLEHTDFSGLTRERLKSFVRYAYDIL